MSTLICNLYKYRYDLVLCLFELQLSGDSSIGFKMDISATDLDKGSNGQVKFFLLSWSVDKDVFGIDSYNNNTVSIKV